MQSINLPIALPLLVTSLKYRPVLPCVGLRNSPYVPLLSPAYASVDGITISNRCGILKVKATQIDVLSSDKQQVEEEYLLAAGLQAEAMPKHIGVISDGNRRWARQKGWPEKSGHMSLALVYKELSRLCCKCGIKVLTAYLFSSENWKRSQEETDSLMIMFEEEIRSNLQESMRHDIRISVIGDRTRLPKSLIEVITEAEEKTKAKSRLHLILAIGYSGQSDILQACKKLCKKVKDALIQEEEINEKMFEQELGTSICTQFSFPDLLIRTAGDLRLSNFLCYQSAYAELYFTKTLFPDFGEEEFIMALKSFQERHRRNGGGK